MLQFKGDSQTNSAYLIKLELLAAKNLIGAKLNGTSDPYVIITCGNEKRFRCVVLLQAYLSQAALSGSQAVYPLVVAAHPQEPNQFAVGLTDGSVKVIEPSESDGKWGSAPPADNGVLNGRQGQSPASNIHTPDQAQR
ncbi:hypothetical protein K1719_024221 [Acacia pycnantha]|nr:hypothetical protein K1719_038465 [Acacia pycnantha]KAI9100859.1 hypothetical protein K1719_024221 [Acacia pycnantha]